MLGAQSHTNAPATPAWEQNPSVARDAAQASGNRFNAQGKAEPKESAVSEFEALLAGADDDGAATDSKLGTTSPFGKNQGASPFGGKPTYEGDGGNKLAPPFGGKPIVLTTKDGKQSGTNTPATAGTTTAALTDEQKTLGESIVGGSERLSSDVEGDKTGATDAQLLTEVTVDAAVDVEEGGSVHTVSQSHQSTQSSEVQKPSLLPQDRAAEVNKLVNVFNKEVGLRDLHATKKHGLSFNLNSASYPGTSVSLSLEAGQTVVDIQSIDPEVSQFLRDARGDINRELGANVTVRVQERDQQSGEHQQEQQQQQYADTDEVEELA